MKHIKIITFVSVAIMVFALVSCSKTGKIDSENTSSDEKIELNESNKTAQVLQSDTTSSLQNNGFFVPFAVVWNGNLYKMSNEELKENDIDELHIDSEFKNISFYSIKNKDMSKCIAKIINGKIYQYECIATSPILVNGKKYILLPRDSVDIKRINNRSIGKYNGFNLYQSDREKYILADVQYIIGTSGYCGYPARLID